MNGSVNGSVNGSDPWSEAKFSAFLESLENEYRSPDYHTAVHAADVTQVVAWLLSQGLFEQVTPTQAFALLVAAAAHDVGHPGLNNAHLVATESEAAQRWNDVSVNENGHLHTALRLLRLHEVFGEKSEKKREDEGAGVGGGGEGEGGGGGGCFSQEEKMSFFALVRRLILSTDMEKHTQLVADFANMAASEMARTDEKDNTESDGDGDDDGDGDGDGSVDHDHDEEDEEDADGSATPKIRVVSEWSDPGLVLCYVLHCADISNPARPFAVANKWVGSD